MANNLLKPFIPFGVLLAMLSCSLNSYADGHMEIVTNVLEEARIVEISSVSNPSSAVYEQPKGPVVSAPTTSLGVVTYENPDCTKCTTSNLNYGQSTKIINPFGAEKSIEELESWRGSRAQITYRVADNHIIEIKILP